MEAGQGELGRGGAEGGTQEPTCKFGTWGTRNPQVQLFGRREFDRRAQAEAYATGLAGWKPALHLEGEDLEVALAGEDYAEEAAVGGEGIFADG